VPPRRRFDSFAACKRIEQPARYSAESVAQAIFDGVANGEEEIFPDPLSAAMADSWRSSAAKALERENAALTEAALAEAEGVRS
jgi:hypothetical protein